MPGNVHIEGRPEQGVTVLRVKYAPELILQADASQALWKGMVDKYQEISSRNEVNTKSCAVIIESETAGSPVVRALFELYRIVSIGGGQVVCIAYPSDYLDSLTSLGLLDLPGFRLSSTLNEALTELVPN